MPPLVPMTPVQGPSSKALRAIFGSGPLNSAGDGTEPFLTPMMSPLRLPSCPCSPALGLRSVASPEVLKTPPITLPAAGVLSSPASEGVSAQGPFTSLFTVLFAHGPNKNDQATAGTAEGQPNGEVPLDPAGTLSISPSLVPPPAPVLGPSQSPDLPSSPMLDMLPPSLAPAIAAELAELRG
eukprot:TRINITY_DN15490_c0_g1_i1.p2 TRINITY_DN15490_c0_g1~~TRINITY_DN15490_c0_g1_i1.p2  ORF type:complete len:182 (+),score=24.79 TRINITY_DN15490_c0_g1_i1:99-644(+)